MVCKGPWDEGGGANRKKIGDEVEVVNDPKPSPRLRKWLITGLAYIVTCTYHTHHSSKYHSSNNKFTSVTTYVPCQYSRRDVQCRIMPWTFLSWNSSQNI